MAITYLGKAQKSPLFRDCKNFGDQYLIQYNTTGSKLFGIKFLGNQLVSIGLTNVYASENPLSHKCPNYCVNFKILTNRKCECLSCVYGRKLNQLTNKCTCLDNFIDLNLTLIANKDVMNSILLDQRNMIGCNPIANTIDKFNQPSIEFESAMMWLSNVIPVIQFKLQTQQLDNNVVIDVYQITYKFQFIGPISKLDQQYLEEIIIFVAEVSSDQISNITFQYCYDQEYQQKQPDENYGVPFLDNEILVSDHFARFNDIFDARNLSLDSSNPENYFQMFWSDPGRELKIVIFAKDEIEDHRSYNIYWMYSNKNQNRPHKYILKIQEDGLNEKLHGFTLRKSEIEIQFNLQNNIEYSKFDEIESQNFITAQVSGLPNGDLKIGAVVCVDKICRNFRKPPYFSWRKMNYIQIFLSNPFLQGQIIVDSIYCKNNSEDKIRLINIMESLENPLRKHEIIIGFLSNEDLKGDDYVSVFIQAHYEPEFGEILPGNLAQVTGTKTFESGQIRIKIEPINEENGDVSF